MVAKRNTTGSGKKTGRRKKRSKLSKRAYILLGLLFLIVAFTVSFDLSVARSTSSLDMKVVVNRTDYNYGVSITSNELDFGEMPLGGVSRKFLSISNNGRYLALVNFRTEGNISDFIELDMNDILLSPSSGAEVTVKLNATNRGVYSGKLVITMMQAKNRLGVFYLKHLYGR